MRIINDLANSSINENKKDSLATRLSILLSVILLGTVIFIIDASKKEQYNFIISTIGDYQVSVAGIDENMYEYLNSDKNIKSLSFDKTTSTNYNATLYQKSAKSWELQSFKIIAGKKPTKENEIIVPTHFLNRNGDLNLGSKIKIKDKFYTIVGRYEDYSYSFEDSLLLGYIKDDTKENLFEKKSGVEAYIWYKNPRDTYSLTRKFLKEFNIDESKAISIGRLYYNRDILEYKMIYPKGIIPPKSVIREAVENYGFCILLILLFSIMIYGAFNVYNNRNLKELALLKSVGMTKKQIVKLIRLKAAKLSLIPIFIGLFLSYICSNLLLYLMWINNSITYRNISKILGEKMQECKFHIIIPSINSFILILLFSFVTVYISAIVPARKSAKLNIIEGLNGILESEKPFGRSNLSGKIEFSLARDYFKSYKSTYITIVLAIVVSAMVMTLVLVTQSYRSVNQVYNEYKSPYNFVSRIYTNENLDKSMFEKLKNIHGVDDIHIFSHKDFKVFLEDNKTFFSDELVQAINNGKKSLDHLFVRIYGLSEDDFKEYLKNNNLNLDSKYVLLNCTPDNNESPYSFRNYIKVKSKDDFINIRYNADGKKMSVKIDDLANSIPYDIDQQEKSGIYIFTDMTNFREFFQANGKDKSDSINYYTVNIKAKNNLEEVCDKAENIILEYVPKSDHVTSTDIIKAASNSEQRRNEHLLNLGIQIILLIIALSNAYNSFHGNLRSRKREFQLLSTAGMTSKQMKKMVYCESWILFVISFISYVIVFFLEIILRSYRSSYSFGFIFRKILENINYFPIVLIFSFMVIGILLAIKSSLNSILNEDLNDTIRDI